MHARTAVITGAAGGLGRATAQQLRAAGYDVVGVTRNARSASELRRDLHTSTGGAARTLHADLLDRDSTRALAADLRQAIEQVDVLINNAGAAFPRYAETSDGAERTHALNHLAPFQLTHLLLADGLLAADARIINISSDLVSRGRMTHHDPDVTGVGWRNGFSQMRVYGSAKLANLLATSALAQRLPTGMSAYSANPGVIRTGFSAKAGGLLGAAAALNGVFAQSPERAARTPVLLAIGPTPPDAGYARKGALADLPRSARDPALASAVYEHTARALGVPALRLPRSSP